MESALALRIRVEWCKALSVIAFTVAHRKLEIDPSTHRNDTSAHISGRKVRRRVFLLR